MSSAATSKAKRPPDRINKRPGAVRIINADNPHMQEAVAEWERVQAEEWETIEADKQRSMALIDQLRRAATAGESVQEGTMIAEDGTARKLISREERR
jgi:hypothetical protein